MGASDRSPTDLHRRAVLLVSFGGPEGLDDVEPFLRNVTAGRGVPAERLAEVAARYELLGGVSPLNQQNRELRAALEAELEGRGVSVPVYWGNRNWHPLLTDTVAEMAEHGVTEAVAVVTSAFCSPPGCQQYLDDIERARDTTGPDAPVIDRIRPFFDEKGFVDPWVANIAAALEAAPDPARLVFTAHSIPEAMADRSPYVEQLRTTAGHLAERVHAPTWDLAWQSRSGPPSVPWLAPDINDHLATLAEQGERSVVVAPIGFLSDHMEVVWDLDIEAKETADRLGMTLHRAATIGHAEPFVQVLADRVEECFLADPPPACPAPAAIACELSGRR